MWESTPERRPPSAQGGFLTTAQKAIVCSELALAKSCGVRGALAQVHRAWKITKTTAARVYKHFMEQATSPGEVSMSRKKRKGRPSTMDAEWDGVTAALAPKKRKTYRRWASAAGKSLSTLYRWSKAKGFKAVRLNLKPKLSEQHKLNRIAYVLGQVIDLDARRPRYKNMYGHVHIDEKWFYLMANGKTVIVGPDEKLPDCPAVQHKSHIPKAMFISVLGRPDPNFNFSGLICIESCTEVVEARRKSKHRAAGELTEVDVSVTSEYYRKMMEEVLVPAIIIRRG